MEKKLGEDIDITEISSEVWLHYTALRFAAVMIK
jgi:hypothetical protein